MAATAIPFLGLRASDDFIENARPKNWRETTLRLEPNGMTPLVALSSMFRKESTNDPEFNWFERLMPEQTVVITALTTSAGGSAYTVAGAAGDTIYAYMSAENSKNFRKDLIATLIDSTDDGVHLTSRVLGTVQNGSSSYVVLKLLEADSRGVEASTKANLYLGVTGSAHEEGAQIPQSIKYDPNRRYNYTQIFRTSMDITRTAKKTRLRTGNAYEDLKYDTKLMHDVEMEMAWIFGIRSENTGDNGKPLRTSMGIIEAIETYASTNHFNFKTDTDTAFAGKEWEDVGDRWLDEKLEVLFRLGSSQRLALCGSSVLLAIQRLVRKSGVYNLETVQTSFGMNVTRWVTPFGELMLKTHPLMTQRLPYRSMMLVVEPKNFVERYIDDTMFKKDTSMNEGGFRAEDAQKEEFLTETGLEFHHMETMGIFRGVGSTNTVS